MGRQPAPPSRIIFRSVSIPLDLAEQLIREARGRDCSFDGALEAVLRERLSDAGST